MRLRTKIILTYIVITVAGMVLAATISSWLITNHLSEMLEDRATGQLTFLSTLFTKGSLAVDENGMRDEELHHVARVLGVRLTVIRRDGRVVYDSDVARDSLGKLDDHRTRAEITQAQGGITGRSRRHSASVDADFFYAASMITGESLGGLDSGFVRIALPYTEVQRLDVRIMWITGAVGGLILVVMMVVSIQLSKRVTDPIRRIVSTATAITRGQVDQRINLHTRDEVGELATAIDGMAEKLGRDISELQRLQRVRSEFLANVSHELRTPIFSIQGFLETLLDGAIDDPHVNREFLDKAYSHAERLNTLLADLIEISRIESGEMKMSFRYFSVLEFLREVMKEMQPAARKKSIGLSIESEFDGSAKVYGDQDRLKQVMLNLIDNAIKYTQPQGTVVVRAYPSKHQCEIAVEDSGPGIAPEHLPRIFERFYRVDRDRSREIGGTGLGLAIVKHIVEAHGATITVASEVGRGSLFSFTLKR